MNILDKVFDFSKHDHDHDDYAATHRAKFWFD